VKGGRCEACQGDGVLKIEMHFLPDVYVRCDVCKGQRYNRETLEIKFRDKSIAEVLAMTVDEAVPHSAQMRIHDRLKILQQVGLGHIALGQQATTLSGGEAQRIKLSKSWRAARRPDAASSSTNRRQVCISRTCASCSRWLHALSIRAATWW
jgi:excinuclease ABC subunit A